MAGEYLVRPSDGVVEAWSTARLRFEAAGWQRGLRAELRDALASLPGGGGFLAATYASARADRCDVENVLFYNVGSGFSNTTRAGLRFERSYAEPPPPPAALAGPAAHYHRYEPASPGGPFGNWREGETLARFEQVPLRRLTSETKPGEVWLALRRHQVETVVLAQPSAAFSVRLRLRVPASAASAAALVKPLLDGVVSALHAHDGSNADQIGGRLAAQLALRPGEVARLLAGEHDAPLGVRRLILPRGAGVQWAPDDDRCVACEITLARDGTLDVPVLSGTVHAVNPG